ncbi:aromatic acid exporter family protein [Hathewaya histolytica]|uniref:aromatic acid exporter family protein n=1 Tax=Hathewaya histolytica TaxID=1498 RepID=UPI003B67797A
MRFIGFRTLKTAIGATLAMIIAEKLGLKFAVSAGIITILSLHNTKKQSIEFAFKRFISTILALLISCILFMVLGFKAIVFGIYLLIFIPLAVRLRISEGIVVSSVLVTHILSQKSVSVFWIKNELLLMFVGAGIAIILNLYMPNIEAQLKEDEKYIENNMKQIFSQMAITLRKQYVSIYEESLFNNLEERLNKAHNRAYTHFNNYLFQNESPYIMYFEMRNIQFQILKYMRKHFLKLSMTFEETCIVAEFTERVSHSIDENISTEELLLELEELKKFFRKKKLPVTREEFENRAILFQFLNDIENFLEIEKEFLEYI